MRAADSFVFRFSSRTFLFLEPPLEWKVKQVAGNKYAKTNREWPRGAIETGKKGMAPLYSVDLQELTQHGARVPILYLNWSLSSRLTRLLAAEMRHKIPLDAMRPIKGWQLIGQLMVWPIEWRLL